MSRDNELTGSELRRENSKAYAELSAMVRSVRGRPVPQGLLNILLRAEAEIDELESNPDLQSWEVRDAIRLVRSEAYESITTRYRNYLSLLQDIGRW